MDKGMIKVDEDVLKALRIHKAQIGLKSYSDCINLFLKQTKNKVEQQ